MPRFQVSESTFLRPLEERDADELYALVDENRSYLARWMPWAEAQMLQGTGEFIRSAIKQEEDGNGFQVALVADRAIVGLLGYHGIDDENSITRIGYWLAEERQGAGLITAAVRLLVAHAFDEWGLNRVEIRAAPDNHRSRAIPERLGFHQEGVLRQAERFGDGYRDFVLYSILASEWSG
jgi:ribosomal-protein-serine acetyltransferase